MEQMDLPGMEPKSEFTQKGWKGVDLDGTLSEYTGWIGFSKIGKPIENTVKQIVEWAKQGWEVRVLTARVAPDPNCEDISVEERVKVIRAWLDEFVQPQLPKGYPPLKITHEKTKELHEFWDDRCTQVVSNMGVPVVVLLQNAVVGASQLLSGNMTDNNKKDFAQFLQQVGNLFKGPEDLPKEEKK